MDLQLARPRRCFGPDHPEGPAQTGVEIPCTESLDLRARRQWPRDARPYLALGNTAYAAENLPVAIDYYRRGLRRNPANPALANNLASVLGELGCPGAATTLLEPVQAQLAASSQWRPVIAATLAELPAARPEGEFCAALYPGDPTSGLSE